MAESKQWFPEEFGEIYHKIKTVGRYPICGEHCYMGRFGVDGDRLTNDQKCQKCLLLASGPNDVGDKADTKGSNIEGSICDSCNVRQNDKYCNERVCEAFPPYFVDGSAK